MRKITTAVTAAALAFSMLALALPAAAVTGYDSQYNSESAFVNISSGQTQNFQVFFINAGTTTWTRGTGTQVDLAACLDDKTTCNAQDASEASWNSGWLSTTRYATTSNTSVAPGGVGTFSYNVTAPVGALAGTYRFNGDLVLSTTGEKIHPEGYYQDATIGGGGTGAASITSILPTPTGSASGGESRTINGSGIVCTPAFPSVSFGGTNAAVNSCGSTSVGVTTPAHAPGSVTVTLTNSGQAASNGLTFTYNDTTAPAFTGAAVSANVVTVMYSEPVCRVNALAVGDWTVNNITGATNDPVQSDNTPLCAGAPATNNATTATLILANSIPPGALVEVDLNSNSLACTPTSSASCNTNFQDTSGNNILAPQAQVVTATNPSSTPPSITSASGAVSSSSVTINFSQPVYCTSWGLTFPTFTLSSGGTGDPTFDAIGANACGTTQQTADSAFSLHTSKPLPAGTTYTLTYTGTGQIKNVFNVNLPTGSSTSFVTGAADFTPPTMVDARMANNQGSTDFADIGDSFTVTFSEKMNGAQNGAITVQDQDGTTATIQCAATGTAANNQATCVWDSATTTVLTVSLTGILIPGGGATPNLQIPFNITSLTQVQDVAGNPPNVLGSSDRLVDYE